MRGKEPAKRKKYMLRLGGGKFVEVTRDVYLEWHRSRRREKYQAEKKQKHSVCSLDALGGDSGRAFLGRHWENTTEDNAVKAVYMEKLRESVSRLSEQDARLLDMLFFEGMTVTDVALSCGCSRKCIRRRREKVLRWLRLEMAKV